MAIFAIACVLLNGSKLHTFQIYKYDLKILYNGKNADFVIIGGDSGQQNLQSTESEPRERASHGGIRALGFRLARMDTTNVTVARESADRQFPRRLSEETGRIQDVSAQA